MKRFENEISQSEIIKVTPSTEIPKSKPETQDVVESKEIRELFGGNFFGPEQIEKAFIIKDEKGQDIKLIDLSPAERHQAEQKLIEKLKDDDIKEFLSRPENKKDIEEGKYLLILRVNSIKKDGKTIDLTMKAMDELIAPDMAANGQGEFFYSSDTGSHWYKDEGFYTIDIPTFEWIIVTKDVVSSTLDKNHNDQTKLLIEEAKKIGLDQTKIKRRQPVQIVYDYFVFLRTTNQHLLTRVWEWSDIYSSQGYPMSVGYGPSDGLLLNDRTPDDSDGLLGASLSR